MAQTNGNAQYPTVTLLGMFWCLIASIRAKAVCVFEGPPGIGKSTVPMDVAKALGMGFAHLIPSHHDPIDIAGYPVVTLDGERVNRVPFSEIVRASASPMLFLVDELWNGSLPMQAALQELVLDRRAGDLCLHEQTAMVAATNPIEQSTGGMDRALALRGRVSMLGVEPTADEILAWFDGTPITFPVAEMAPFDQTAHDEAVVAMKATFAKCARFDTRLMQTNPTVEALDNGAQYGAPRNWDRGIKLYVAATMAGAPSDVAWKLMAGCVGDSCQVAFKAIMDLHTQLPAPEAVVANPATVSVPTDRRGQIGALILLPRVADMDLWAAWTYSARLMPEIGLAVARQLQSKPPKGNGANAAAGQRARVAQLAKLSAGRV